mgnify:CR=1 FL=1
MTSLTNIFKGLLATKEVQLPPGIEPEWDSFSKIMKSMDIIQSSLESGGLTQAQTRLIIRYFDTFLKNKLNNLSQ